MKATAKPAASPETTLERPRSLRDQIHDRLRRAILTGSLAPGTPVVESELAETFGASRTPIREALRRLESEGLVEPRGLRGSVVRELRADELACIYEIREALESLAARRASRTFVEGDYRTLESFVKEMRASLDDAVAFERATSAFADYLVDRADGPRLRRMLGELRDDIATWRFLSLSNPVRREATIEEHTAILAAMRSCDEEAIAAATTAHLRNARASVLAQLAQR